MSDRKLAIVPESAPSPPIDSDLVAACRTFRELRRQLFRSQLEASIELGLGRATVERIERCESDPRGSVLARMRRLLEERASKKSSVTNAEANQRNPFRAFNACG